MTGENSTQELSSLEAAYSHCAAFVREHDVDCFIASLFAPDDRRRHLHALYAYDLEIARIRDLVHEPLPGEIRLQWWRDVLDSGRAGEAAGSPVAMALMDTVAQCGLPVVPLIAASEARIFDLYEDPMPSLNDLEGYCGETDSALMQLAMIVLSKGGDPGGGETAGHAGVAIGITRVLTSVTLHMARGQTYVPVDILANYNINLDRPGKKERLQAIVPALAELAEIAHQHLDQARQAARNLSDDVLPALLTLALVAPRLKRLKSRPLAVDQPFDDLPQWRRQWLLWRASRRGI